MLLTIHNLHFYKKFFETIRESIKNDKLNQLIELVAEQYKDAEKTLNYEPVEENEKATEKKRKLKD